MIGPPSPPHDPLHLSASRSDIAPAAVLKKEAKEAAKLVSADQPASADDSSGQVARENRQAIAEDSSIQAARQNRQASTELAANLKAKQLREELESRKRLRPEKNAEEGSVPPNKELREGKGLHLSTGSLASVGASSSDRSVTPRLISAIFHQDESVINAKVIQKGGLTTQNLFLVCNDLARERFASASPINEEEIRNFNHLYFETDLRSLSDVATTTPLDLINPSPSFVFQSLNGCLQALGSYNSCQEAVQAAEDCAAAHPAPGLADDNIEYLLSMSPRALVRELADLRAAGEEGLATVQNYERFLSDQANYQSRLSRYPIVATSTLLETDNVNATYVLHNLAGKKCWVFKPTEQPSDPNICFREHTASLVNDSGRFPIPLTLLVNLRGMTGSAQLFVEGGKTLIQIENAEDQISVNDLHAIAIYDMLFGNTDRHEGNILCVQQGAGYRAFAIDHDQCFMGNKGKPLSKELLDLSAFAQPFAKDLETLISVTTLASYRRALQTHGVKEEGHCCPVSILVILRTKTKHNG